MARHVLTACIILGGLAMAAMTAMVFMWMTVPVRIVYRESSPILTDVYRVEVREHGHSHFITPAQKQKLDQVRNGTPVVVFGGFTTAFLTIVVGAAARLRIKGPLA